MSTTRKNAGNLKRHAALNPNAVYLTTDVGDGTAINVLFSGGYTKLCQYTRARDARRALRDLGFQQEGRYWRKAAVPVMEHIRTVLEQS